MGVDTTEITHKFRVLQSFYRFEETVILHPIREIRGKKKRVQVKLESGDLLAF